MSEEQTSPTIETPRAAVPCARHWWQISLRSLLLSIVAICLALGFVLHRAREQEKSVQAIERAYGRVLYDYHRMKDGKFDTNTVSRLPTWVTRGLCMHVWHTVLFVDLDSEQVTDETLAVLKNLHRLEVLHISNTSITNDGLIVLGSLPALRIVTLNTADIDDLAIEHIADCPSLEELELHDADVTDTGLLHLKRARRLRRLWLNGTQVTDLGVRQLQAALPKCRIEY